MPVFDLHVAVRLDQLGKDWVSTMTVGVLFGNSVVVYGPYGQQVGKHGRSPVVVPMEVGGDQVVDLFQPGLSCGNSMDASGVSRARVAGVDEDGFTRRGFDQGCRSPLHVHPIQVEGCSWKGGWPRARKARRRGIRFIRISNKPTKVFHKLFSLVITSL